MKFMRSIQGTFAILVALLFCSVAGAIAENLKPIAHIAEPTYDFGTVSEGTKVVKDFIISNTGKADLVIQKIVPSCGCTAASVSNDPIAPGKNAIVHVQFDTAGFSGEKFKTVRILTNDSDNANPVLALRGTIESDIEVEPKSLMFGDIFKGRQEAKEFTIKVRPGSKIKVADVKTLSPNLILEDLGKTADSRRYRVKPAAGLSSGEYRDRVVIELQGGKGGAINIPVFMRVLGDILVQPSQVSFGIVEGRAEIERSVKIENRSSKLLTIKGVRTNNDALTTSVKVIEKGRIMILHLKLNPLAVTKDLRAQVEVITDNSDENKIIIPVYGVLPPKI